MRVADAEALIDFRIEPEFGALPQPHAGEQRGVRRLAALAAMRQAVGTLIGRSDRRVALPREGGLAVEIDQVQVGCRLPLGDDRPRVRRRGIVAELIVQTGAHLLHRKVGIEVLRAAKERRAAIAVTGEQIFEPRRPMRCDRCFDAGSGGVTQSPQERRFARAGGDLRQRLLVIGPGEAAGRVEQPAAGRVADAAAHGAGSQHRLAIGFRAQRRRSQVRYAAGRDAVPIRKGRKRCIDLAADHDPVRQHVVVAALQSGEEASGLG